MKLLSRLILGVALVAALSIPAFGQGLFATLTGIVSDPSGAVVPGASVKLISESSGSVRVTTTDASGYFTFASVIVGDFTYKLTVEAKGFSTYAAPGLSLLGGQKRNVNVTLKVGATTQTVEVSGVASAVVPQDSGEKSETLTSKELQNFVQVGTDAAAFIKIMPGFAIQNGTSNVSNYSGEVIGINANGDAGSQSPLNNAYSYNGLPSNSLDIMADGAHVSDPGCNCDTPVNPNSNMVSEMKVNMSNFNAENQKGPIVVTSVTKSGGSHFHGSGFFSARNYTLNANDALNNSNGAPKPGNKYYYPGFTFGGPVIIPGTDFNKNRDKLFFFTGYQYFYQVLDTGLLRATVPTSDMLNGNFSTASLEKIGDATNGYRTGSGVQPGVDCNTGPTYTPCLIPDWLTLYPGGIIPTTDLNTNMLNLMKLYPAANADPNATGGYNYVQSQVFNQNNVQWATRVDYNISDYTKMFVRYNLQRETQQFPVGLWWRQNQQVPYPTPVLGKNRSDSISASLTHVFNPTLTNEFVFGYTFIGFPNVLQDPSKVDRTQLGVNITGLFKNGVTQIPSFGNTGGGGEAALVFNPGGFEAGGASAGLYANKYMPSISDTVAKVVSTHTIKAGFYWEWIRNAQPANGNTNGYLTFVASGNNNSTGDTYADEVLGIANSYNETSFNRINDIAYNSYEWFVQDDWKVTKRLTLNLGLRFSHFQPWADRLGFGYPIFDPSQFQNNGCAAAPTYCGFIWHKKDASVPLGGFPTRALFYQPRIGVAYDLFGNGSTVLRGGWGRYYFHAGQFTNGLDAAAGVESTTIGFNAPLPGTNNPTQPLIVDPLQQYPGTYPQFGGAVGLNSLPFSAAAAAPAAVDASSSKEPYTDSYNVTISRRLPWSSLLQVAYVGNRTRDIPSSGNGGTLGANSLNLNLVPQGAMLASNNNGADPNSLVADNFRPFLGYSDLYVTTQNAYSNYNALQVTWNRTKGRYTMALNYTYGKSMGILGFYNQFNLADNYGVLAANRTHIFNAAYSIVLPSFAKGKLAGGFVNGWQLSGVTQIESGANLSGNRSQNFGMDLHSAKIPVPGVDCTDTNDPNYAKCFNISNVSLLGTPDIQLNPILTCNPTQGLTSHQYINPSCFQMPMQVGQNGGNIMPPIYGPAYVGSDLGLFKTFKITESQSLQFRVEGYNFMNHALWSFPGNQNLNLSFDPATGKADNPLFGTTTTKQGHRILELSIRYDF